MAVIESDSSKLEVPRPPNRFGFTFRSVVKTCFSHSCSVYYAPAGGRSCHLPIVPIPMIPSFTHSMGLALNPPARRSLEEITLETKKNDQHRQHGESCVGQKRPPLHGVSSYQVGQ